MAGGHFEHAIVTMTGSSVNLGTLIEALGYAGITASTAVLNFDVQPLGGNTHVIYLGAARRGAVASDDYGVRLESPVTSIPQAPYKLMGDRSQAPAQLDDFLALGTNSEKLSCFFQLANV